VGSRSVGSVGCVGSVGSVDVAAGPLP
jgi:hypothetical protein